MLQGFYNLRYWLSWIVLAGIAAAVIYWGFVYETDPRTMRVAVDAEQAGHGEFGAALKRNVERETDYRVQLLRADGPDDSRSRVLDGNADVAIVQLGSVNLRNLAAVTPLWDEYIHLFVRQGSGIEAMADLAGRGVAIGPEDSANRAGARALLAYHGLEPGDLSDASARPGDLVGDDGLDAAIAIGGLTDPALRRLMATGDFDLLPIAGTDGFAFNHRHYRAAAIPTGVYPAGRSPQPAQSLAVPSVDAVMVARPDLHDGMVTAAVEVTRSADMRARFPGLVDRDPLADPVWRALPLHPAAEEAYAGAPQLTTPAGLARVLVDHAAWLLLLVIIVPLAGYQFWRHRRHHQETHTYGVRREIERLFQEVSRLEATQREARDVRVLQEHLNEINNIQMKAMKLALGTPIAESSLFLAFLQQARAVSQQIEWRLSMSAGLSASGDRGEKASVQPARGQVGGGKR